VLDAPSIIHLVLNPLFFLPPHPMQQPSRGICSHICMLNEKKSGILGSLALLSADLYILPPNFVWDQQNICYGWGNGRWETGIPTCSTRTPFPWSQGVMTSILDSSLRRGLTMQERSARVLDSSSSASFIWVERWIGRSRERVRAPKLSDTGVAGVVGTR